MKYQQSQFKSPFLWLKTPILVPIPAPIPGTFGAFLGGSPSTGVAGGVHCGVSGPAGAAGAGAVAASAGAAGAGGGASVGPVVSMASVARVGEWMKNLLMKHAGVRDIATLHDAK